MDLQKLGLLQPDREAFVRGLESSEILYREMRSIYEAFGVEPGSRAAYADHVGHLLREYKCIAK